MRLRRAGDDVTGRRAPVRDRNGFVIIAVLIVIVVLSLAAYRFTDLMTAEYRAAARSQSAAQVRLAARSGVHYAAAVLADPNILYGQLGGNPYADGAIPAQVVRDGDQPNQQASFMLVAVAPDGTGGFAQKTGCVLDESARLNVNALIAADKSGQVLFDALLKLPNMTADLADAIVDWVDADDDPRDAGAESDYYAGLGSPYRAKNGPLNSVEELLLVRGMTPQLLFGNDRNRNGVADDDPAAGSFDRGLADYLTVYGRELNVDADGSLRINVNESENLPDLYQRLAGRLPQDLADFILAYKMFSVQTGTTSGRTTTATSTVAGGPEELNAAVTLTLDTLPVNKNPIKTLLDLVTARVTLPAVPGAAPNTPRVVVTSPLADPARFAELFGLLTDRTTTTTTIEMVPRVNVNTAPREVLVAIPQMTEEEADAIVAQRDAQSPTAPGTISGGWVVTSGAVSQQTFRRVERYITGKTMVYRVQAVGYFGRGGPTARVEAVIDTNQGAPRILYFRDLTDLDAPRGFEPVRE
jgi:type II secretory pathway component PulK